MSWLPRTVVALLILLDAGSALAIPGLDQRPSNSTCLARPRPGVGSDVAIATERMFPFLTLSSGSEWTLASLAAAPMVLRQSTSNPGIWYLAERSGLIHRIDDVARTHTPLLDIRSEVFANFVDSDEEGGLLGMALHPNFDVNGEVFVFYTAAAAGYACTSTVSRFRSLDGGMTVDPSSETVLLSIPQATIHHHAGALEFGNDGMLYISVGDSGLSTQAQNLNSLLGSILRIDVDAGVLYTIPPDNPFASGGGAPEVWAKGLRNPYRFSIDPVTGELWAGDVGQSNFEEVNRIVSGGNYGWPIREGFSCFGTCCTQPTAPSCMKSPLIDPVHAYDHSGGSCRAVIGGYVYRGSEFPELEGRYLFSDWCGSDIRAFFSDPGTPPYARTIGQIGGLFRSLSRDASGELYALRTREIHKLVRSTAPPPAPFPRRLSETGCVDAADPTLPAEGLIPYAVNAPLWSDGADKDRWMALPDGKTISILPDGDWSLPIGSVLVKNFLLAAERIETRLLMRHSDGGWAGYSYEWNDAGTDADLLEDTKMKVVGNQTWLYPSRGQCLSCHTEVAGFTLGPTTAQLNGSFRYNASQPLANQLETLEHIGVLDSPPDFSQRITTSQPASIAVLARSYLQANCAHCHAPGTPVQASIDLRYSTPINEMHVCGAVPSRGDLGVAGARLLVPGDPSRSILSLRMHDLGDYRMPPLATSVVDPLGTTLIDTWISSFEAAPDGSCIARADTQCGDGLDNDANGLTDFPADPGCSSPLDDSESTIPGCEDGSDNDWDGLTDYPADPGCSSPSDDTENSAALICDDGIDNDGDRGVDYRLDGGDPGCASPTDDSEKSPALVCDNSLDDDGDGLTDYPADPGCTNPADASERPACADRIDNDSDGLIDFPSDPGCANADATRENPMCQDGIDNEGDGTLDFDGGASANRGVPLGPPDPKCVHPYDNKERPTCGLGAELVLVMPLLGLATSRRRRAN